MFRLSKAAAAFDDSAQPTVSVSFMRQIEAVVGSHHAFRSFVIGEGTLRSVPPDVASSTTLVPPADGYQTLNWEGEIKCQKNVTDVGFSVGKLMIKASLYNLATPPSVRATLSLPLAYSIRLVGSYSAAAGAAEPKNLAIIGTRAFAYHSIGHGLLYGGP